MASTFKTPGVYIQEIAKFPPSVAAVETAIPAFIGYTEKVEIGGVVFDSETKIARIRSLADYEAVFGGPFNEGFGTIEVEVSSSGETSITSGPVEPTPTYRMYYCLQMYFLNGGGPCYIVSVGRYDSASPTISKTALEGGVDLLEQEDEPTLLVFPDAVSMDSATDFYAVQTKAIDHCAKMQDRFAIIDVYNGNIDYADPTIGQDVINGDGQGTNTLGIRNGIGLNNLKYAAAYYPWVETVLTYAYSEFDIVISGTGTGVDGVDKLRYADDADAASSLYHSNNELYNKVKAAIADIKVVAAPAAIMAGVYARIDSTLGVWKAPANVSLLGVSRPLVKIDNESQEDLNVHQSGKSIDAIRSFKGKGVLVWGARTLDGNDNEWRYISVRRFFIFAEESIKKATEAFVFEPNDANTWVKIRGMIENFLTLQWKAGALQGSTPEKAFYVKVGLNETMTALDILEGRLIVEIGMAVVRPAEFIILKFSHKMQES